MALDGRGNFIGTHNRPPPKSRQIEYGTSQEEAMEEDMVGVLHARPVSGPRDEAPNTGQGRRLRRAHAHGRRFRSPAALKRHHHHPHGLHPSPRRGSSAAAGADVHRESEALSLHQPRAERTILSLGEVSGDARPRRQHEIERHAVSQEIGPDG